MSVTLPTQGGDSGTWGTELNAYISGSGAAYLGEQTAVDLNTASAKTTLYTVPASHVAVITHVLIINDSGTSAAGCTDVSFGDDATCTNWLQAVDLSGLTATAADFDTRLMFSTGVLPLYTATSAFGIYINTAATGAATARIIVFGMEIAA